MVRMLVVGVVLTAWSAWAHDGGLDRYGCHNDRKHGGYHCHGSSVAAVPVIPMQVKPSVHVDPKLPPAVTEALPQVPADAKPVRAPMDRQAATAKPPPSPGKPLPAESTAAKPKPVSNAEGVVCLLIMFAMVGGSVFMVWRWLMARSRTVPGETAPGAPRASSSEVPVEPDDAPSAGPFRLLKNEKKTKRMFEKEMDAYRYSGCHVCTIRIRPGDRIFWDPYDKRARHAGYCEELVTRENAKAAQEAQRQEQVKRSAAFHKLMERLNRAKTSATRENIVATAQADDALTPQQRLRLLLEASKMDTDDTLEKVEVLKSKAVKRRRLEETLAQIKGDAVPDEMQFEQIALLEEAIRTLDVES